MCLETAKNLFSLKNLVLNKLELENDKGIRLEITKCDLNFGDQQTLEIIWKNTPKLKGFLLL